MQAIGAGMIALLHDNDVATARPSAWLAGNDMTAAAFGWRLVWMLGASLAALAFAELSSPRRTAVESETLPEQQAAERQTAPPPRPSAALPSGSAFDQSNYSVRTRMSLLNPFVRRYSEYEIRSIPPMSSARFSFSWKTGFVKREPGGPVLLAMTPAAAPGLFLNRSYAVTEGTSGAPLGELVPSGSDWKIVGAAGQPLAYVLRGAARAGFVRYDATFEERELCRFTWTLGATIASAELELEFMPDADPAFRLLAVALAPILELRARLFSERRNNN
jgi:hypothetical protein